MTPEAARLEHEAGAAGAQGSEPLRVLIVSIAFPPYNAIGAVRIGKMAKYLRQWGHDVRVLTAADQSLAATLPVEIEQDRLIAVPYLNAARPAELLLGGRRKVSEQGFAPGGGSGALRRIFAGARDGYKLLMVPDEYIGWYPYAIRAGRRLLEQWRPDVIYASALPVTSLVVARALATRFEVPLVAELRDLWTDNHYVRHPQWRSRLEHWLERRTLAGAAGIVTVSRAWVDVLSRRYGVPTTLIANGYDPADFAPADPPAPGPLRIVHTGMIYPGKRDPRPLFQAMETLGLTRDDVRIEFYGKYLGGVASLAREHGIAELVEVREQLPYRDSLALQVNADVLLLLMWDDPRERPVHPGKVFEYIGAGRPVLGVGPTESEVAELLESRGVGAMLRDPAAIASQLRRWIEQKRATGSIPAPAAASTTDLTREAQARRLEQFLGERVREARSPVAAAAS